MSKATNNMTSQKAVSPQEKAAFFAEFNNGLHRIGRITLVLAVIMLVSVPFIVGAMNGVMPDMKGFLKGFATVGLIYIPVAIVEFLVYTPMLGVGGSYLSFITGNVTNMKIPCVMNAKDIAKYIDKEGNKKEYRILMNIEETSNDVNYLVYTDDSVNENGELNVSVSSYVLSDKGNITKFKELETKEEYKDCILFYR